MSPFYEIQNASLARYCGCIRSLPLPLQLLPPASAAAPDVVAALAVISMHCYDRLKRLHECDAGLED